MLAKESQLLPVPLSRALSSVRAGRHRHFNDVTQHTRSVMASKQDDIRSFMVRFFKGKLIFGMMAWIISARISVSDSELVLL